LGRSATAKKKRSYSITDIYLKKYIVCQKANITTLEINGLLPTIIEFQNFIVINLFFNY